MDVDMWRLSGQGHRSKKLYNVIPKAPWILEHDCSCSVSKSIFPFPFLFLFPFFLTFPLAPLPFSVPLKSSYRVWGSAVNPFSGGKGQIWHLERLIFLWYLQENHARMWSMKRMTWHEWHHLYQFWRHFKFKSLNLPSLSVARTCLY